MTMWESWCFYVGEIATWVVPMLAAMAYGYWIAIKFGSWKAWAKDFFGLEEQK